MIKKYLKSYLYLFSIIILLTIILSILNYFIPFKSNIFKIIIPIISIFISSIMLGKSTQEKAYLEGIKFSTLFLFIITIFRIIIKISFNYKTFIMYFVLIISSIIGSMLGINLKKE